MMTPATENKKTKPTTDPALKRLRWVMVGALIGDITITLVGQPAIYWLQPAAVRESNHLVAPVLSRGILTTVLMMLVGVAGLLYTVSCLPRKFALMLILAVTFSCYFGISSWLVYDFHLGSIAEMLGAAFFAIILVLCGLDAVQ
jgi:hypothetical protein